MKQYLNLLKTIIKDGIQRDDRTHVGTKSIFGTQLRFNLEDGFPVVTTKKLAWKSVVSELLWFLEGSTDEHRLAEIKTGKRYSQLTEIEKKTIWTDNAENQGRRLGYTHGELGPIYGKQWRNWQSLTFKEIPILTRLLEKFGITYYKEEFKGIDQILRVISSIKTNPFSRRHIVNAWNVADIDDMALPPCHVMFQFFVSPDQNGKPEKLSLVWYQRSVDVGLGLPFNIASYALLLSIIARLTNLKPYELIFNGGDTHIYLNHLEALEKQCTMRPYKLPLLELPEFNSFDELLKCNVSDFKLVNYKHREPIDMKMAV